MDALFNYLIKLVFAFFKAFFSAVIESSLFKTCITLLAVYFGCVKSKVLFYYMSLAINNVRDTFNKKANLSPEGFSKEFEGAIKEHNLVTGGLSPSERLESFSSIVLEEITQTSVPSSFKAPDLDYDVFIAVGLGILGVLLLFLVVSSRKGGFWGFLGTNVSNEGTTESVVRTPPIEATIDAQPLLSGEEVVERCQQISRVALADAQRCGHLQSSQSLILDSEITRALCLFTEYGLGIAVATEVVEKLAELGVTLWTLERWFEGEASAVGSTPDASTLIESIFQFSRSVGGLE